MSRRASRRLRRRREEEVRRLARSGAWYVGPHEERGPGWKTIGGPLGSHGTLPRTLVDTHAEPHRRIWLSDVLRLPRDRWRFLFNPGAAGPDRWPFDLFFVTFFDSTIPTSESPRPELSDHGELLDSTGSGNPSSTGTDLRARVGEETPS